MYECECECESDVCDVNSTAWPLKTFFFGFVAFFVLNKNSGLSLLILESVTNLLKNTQRIYVKTYNLEDWKLKGKCGIHIACAHSNKRNLYALRSIHDINPRPLISSVWKIDISIKISPPPPFPLLRFFSFSILFFTFVFSA